MRGRDPDYDMRTTVLGIRDRAADHPRAGRQLAACSSRAAKRSRRASPGSSGTIYILSTLSGCLLEDVKKATTGPAWYQLYLVGGRDVAMAAIERARKAGYSALVVTIDTPVAGMRERDLRNGMKELLSRGIRGRCCPTCRSSWPGRAGWRASSATAA